MAENNNQYLTSTSSKVMVHGGNVQKIGRLPFGARKTPKQLSAGSNKCQALLNLSAADSVVIGSLFQQHI